jgi:hypothetical protein
MTGSVAGRRAGASLGMAAERQKQRKKQIPRGNDRKKNKSNYNGKSDYQYRVSPLRATVEITGFGGEVSLVVCCGR